MKIAAVDIGTNAVKSKIFDTTPTSINFLDGIRTPIRLGTEVFQNGYLSQTTLNKLVDTLKKYEQYFEKNNIKHFEIVATSAFRDTSNSEDARRYVENEIEHPIRIISGLEEAKLIRFHPKSENSENKIFVDVGGGSTELFFYKNRKIKIKSFQLGAVRMLHKKDLENEWNKLESWLHNNRLPKKLIGLGGNIRTFLNIFNEDSMSSDVFMNKYSELTNISTNNKIKKLNLSPDRADVIDNALEIFKKIIECTDIAKIKSTKWGVSDSIAVKLFHELYSKKIEIQNKKTNL